ncbi:MAG: hypothetical protein JNJ75_03110 [Cyclobacteriaceae bacterium]|nr:hypothetical protein [Cyclobacteriaceae bacterium]
MLPLSPAVGNRINKKLLKFIRKRVFMPICCMALFVQPGYGKREVMGTVIFLMIGVAMLLTIPEKKRA